MRALFLLLIAVNAAYFAWEAVYRPQQEIPSEIDVPAVSTAANSLLLLSEAPEVASPRKRDADNIGNEQPKPSAPRKREEATSLQASDSPAPLPSLCYRISGFDKQTEADVLTAALQQKGARLSGRGASQMGRRNYWVMIPSFQSRAAAQEVVSELQRRGMKDFYLVRSGEYENAISLGVFSTEAAALQRLGRIRALSLSGPRPRLDHIELTAKRYWIEVQWPGSDEPQWKGLVPENPEIEVSRTSCRPLR